MRAVRHAAVVTALLAAVAGACQICLPFPKSSVADYLLQADVVAFAREDPEKPFSLVAVEWLKGEIDDPSIDLFLDSQSRRVLARNPERRLLCVYRSGGEEPGWRRIGMTDSAGLYEPVVRQVLQLRGRWEESPEERPKFFSQFLGHEDYQLSQLAHLEVARAPYDQIKALGGALPPGDVRAFLSNFRYLEWHALYILLLAQSPAEQDRERIREAARSAEKFAITPQLAAWATAWIEIDEAEALQFYSDRYLADPSRDLEEVKAVLQTYSVHGTNGHTHLRDQLVEGYRVLLDARPSLAPVVVEDLTAWKRWELASRVREIVQSEALQSDLQGQLKLRAYLRAAAPATGGEAEAVAGSGRGGFPMVGWLMLAAGLITLPVFLALGRRD